MAGEWRAARFAEICEHSAFGPRFSGESYEKDGNVATLRTTDISADGRIAYEAMPIARLELDRFRQHLLKPGDMVITRSGRIGTAALFKEFRLPVLPGAFLIRFRLKTDVADPLYYRYFFNSPSGQDLLTSVATGSVQQNINITNVHNLEVPLPPLSEQHAIAHILGTLDDKIVLNRRCNQALGAMARALFQDWFVDFGPVRAKMAGQDPYLPADLWQRFPDRLNDEGKPKGWDEKPLDEIAHFLNGLALQNFPAPDADHSLPVIKIAELRNGISTKSDRASSEVPSKYVIKDGDFLFSWSGSLLAKFWTEGEGALNQHLFKVTSERYPMWFVSHWVHHHLEEFQAIAASKATTMGHIQRGHLKAAMTICPPNDVVERMGIVMAPLVEQAIQNELESRTLAQLRDTLLPKLISGALRLKDAEKFISETLE